MDPIGKRVRDRRRALSLSQEALARRAGVSLNLINRVERSETRDPHYSTLVAIATALNISVAELVGETAVPKAQAPSPPLPEGDEGRRIILYLKTELDEALDMASQALRLRDEAQGLVEMSPEEVKVWAQATDALRSRVYVKQQRWEDGVFGPTSEQELPAWEDSLLTQIREEMAKADTAIHEAMSSFAEHYRALNAQIQKEVEGITSEQFLASLDLDDGTHTPTQRRR